VVAPKIGVDPETITTASDTLTIAAQSNSVADGEGGDLELISGGKSGTGAQAAGDVAVYVGDPGASGTAGSAWFGIDSAGTVANRAQYTTFDCTTSVRFRYQGSTKFIISAAGVRVDNGANLLLDGDCLFEADNASPVVGQQQHGSGAGVELTVQGQQGHDTASDGGGVSVRGGLKGSGGTNNGSTYIGVDGSDTAAERSRYVVVDCSDSVHIAQGGSDVLVVDGTGVGFHGTSPAAAQAVTGALSSVTDANAKAVLTSIISALTTPGFSTDSTT
jgi:hypothetical protein